jgi:hypothetical protein
LATLATARPKLRSDDIFFPAMSLLILVIVVTGFARSYFLPGMFLAKLPNALVHVHGALFTSWIVLLVLQNALVAVRKLRWHIALGVFGVILPPLLVVFGVLAMMDSVRRMGTSLPPGLLMAGDLEEVLLFAALTAWGMVARRKPASHKRLMILGTLAMIGPAVNRWPWPETMILPGTIAVCVALPLLLVIYDLCTLRKVHRSTAISYVLIVLMILSIVPVSQMGFWQPFTVWIRHSSI